MLAFAFAWEYVLRGGIVGLTYGLLALGVVLVFRSSNIINFAHGEIGLFAAQAFGVLVLRFHVPYWIGFVLALLIGAAAGMLAEVVLVRRLRNAPRLMSVVATLGFGQFLSIFAVSLSKSNTAKTIPRPPGFPTFKAASFFVTSAHSAIMILSPLVMLLIAGVLRYSRTGIGLRAASANPEAARMAGVSPARMSAIAWGMAGALSAYTALLVIPALGFTATGTTNAPGLLIRALTVAVIARMTSIPITLLAGVMVGMVESILQFNYSNGGPIEVLLFATAMVALLLQSGRRGRTAARDSWIAIAPWAPLVTTVRTHPLVRNLGRITAALGLGIAVLFGLLANNESASTGMLLLRMAIIGLSIVVLTGLAGQLSLGQFGIATIGAVVAARFSNGPGEMLSSILLAGVVGALISVLLGIPALRVRGLMLAVTTLGFAIAMRSWASSQSWMMGSGISLGDRRLFGIDLSTDRRYYWVVLGFLVLTFIVVRNLSKSGFGRRLMAIRDNEDQARAFTISASKTLLSAYAVSGFIAAMLGGIYAHGLGRVAVDSFSVDDSIRTTALAVLGGLGIVAGPLLGVLYIYGVPELPLDSLGIAASSLGWLVLLLYVPSGIAGLVAPIRRFIIDRLGGDGGVAAPVEPESVFANGVPSLAASKVLDRSSGPAGDAVTESASEGHRATGDGAELLRVDGLNKRFGGVVAVNDVSLTVARGETLGLIGPNGAGKTTLFEIIGGFTAADSGVVTFAGKNVSALGPDQRAQLGLVRSFQDAPLFATMTVRDTVRLAHERKYPSSLVSGLLGRSGSAKLISAHSDELIELMGLQTYASKSIHELSTGTRRITELACLMAMEPELLLLDEPSSGIAQRETESLGALLRGVKAHLGTTFIIIEHDMPMIRALSDRLVAMESGTIIAVGKPDEVLADPRVVESYLGGDTTAIERSGVGV
jgi:ABC-type branched-subunit amino acid transport system ATPase component/ABC-type branched-subunit amino acid transport system permease subunit